MAGLSKEFGRWRTWTQTREGTCPKVRALLTCIVGITRSYTTCGRRNYKKPPALGSGIIKRLFFLELMQSSARAFRLERGMRLEFGFQPEGGSWKLWEVGGGSKEKAARGLRK